MALSMYMYGGMQTFRYVWGAKPTREYKYKSRFGHQEQSNTTPDGPAINAGGTPCLGIYQEGTTIVSKAISLQPRPPSRARATTHNGCITSRGKTRVLYRPFNFPDPTRTDKNEPFDIRIAQLRQLEYETILLEQFAKRTETLRPRSSSVTLDQRSKPSGNNRTGVATRKPRPSSGNSRAPTPSAGGKRCTQPASRQKSDSFQRTASSSAIHPSASPVRRSSSATPSATPLTSSQEPPTPSNALTCLNTPRQPSDTSPPSITLNVSNATTDTLMTQDTPAVRVISAWDIMAPSGSQNSTDKLPLDLKKSAEPSGDSICITEVDQEEASVLDTQGDNMAHKPTMKDNPLSKTPQAITSTMHTVTTSVPASNESPGTAALPLSPLGSHVPESLGLGSTNFSSTTSSNKSWKPKMGTTRSREEKVATQSSCSHINIGFTRTLSRATTTRKSSVGK